MSEFSSNATPAQCPSMAVLSTSAVEGDALCDMESAVEADISFFTRNLPTAAILNMNKEYITVVIM